MYDQEYDEYYEDDRSQLTEEEQQYREDCAERARDMREAVK